MKSLAGKTAVVTGAASGIGKATAVTLANYGCRVCLADIDSEGVEQVAATIRADGGYAIASAIDVRDASSNRAVMQYAVAETGALDIVHLNAGVLYRGSVLECSIEEWETSMAVNVTGVFHGIREAANAMAGAHGSIVVTASVAAILASAQMAAYITTKHAVAGLVKAAAADLAPQGIRVNGVCPGATYTGMLLTQGSLEEVNRSPVAEFSPMRRVAEPHEIAELVSFLASDEASYVTGAVYPVDGGSCAVGRRSV